MTQNEIRAVTSSAARDKSLATGSESGVPSRLGRTIIEYGRMPALTLPRDLMSKPIDKGTETLLPHSRVHYLKVPSAGRGLASGRTS